MAAAVVASGALVTTRPRKGYLRVNNVDVYHPCNVASVAEEPDCVVEDLRLGIEPAVLGNENVATRGGRGQSSDVSTSVSYLFTKYSKCLKSKYGRLHMGLNVVSALHHSQYCHT